MSGDGTEHKLDQTISGPHTSHLPSLVAVETNLHVTSYSVCDTLRKNGEKYSLPYDNSSDNSSYIDAPEHLVHAAPPLETNDVLQGLISMLNTEIASDDSTHNAGQVPTSESDAHSTQCLDDSFSMNVLSSANKESLANLSEDLVAGTSQLLISDDLAHKNACLPEPINHVSSSSYSHTNGCTTSVTEDGFIIPLTITEQESNPFDDSNLCFRGTCVSDNLLIQSNDDVPNTVVLSSVQSHNLEGSTRLFDKLQSHSAEVCNKRFDNSVYADEIPASCSYNEHTERVDNSVNRADNILLHKQIDTLSCKLLAAQDQIDRLLEEKHGWLESIHRSQNSVPSGELRGRWIQAKNLADTYKREKESMVVKFAQSEQKCIKLEERVRELEYRLSNLGNCPNGNKLPVKNNEALGDSLLTQTQKELATAQERIENLLKKQTLDESRITCLESKLKTSETTLKSEQKKIANQNDVITRLNKSLECAKKQAKEADRLREREAERLCSELTFRETVENAKRLKLENETLKERLESLESLKLDLAKADLRITELVTESKSMSDLKILLEEYKHREEQLSDCIRRLTEHNATLQTAHLQTLDQLDVAQKSNAENSKSMDEIREQFQEKLDQMVLKTEQLERQLRNLSLQLEASIASESKLKSELKDEKERSVAIHRRDVSRIKDLTRELNRLFQRPQRPEDHGSSLDLNPTTDQLGRFSVDSAAHSLETIETCTQSCKTNDFIQVRKFVNNIVERENSIDCCSLPHSDIDQNALIEKITRLQAKQIKLNDKVEFLQEHCYQLTEELNKKSQVIQHLLVADQKADVLPSHKSIGNLMASLSFSRPITNNLDPDLCLEVNQKLQNILEDTISKNIILKENLSTLGGEISNLNLTKKRLMNLMCPTCLTTAEGVLQNLNNFNEIG